MIVPVFKTGGRRLSASPVGSTPTRFRQFVNDLRTRESIAKALALEGDFDLG